MAQEKLSSREKAAILMISLGKEQSAQIYKHLTDEEIEQITLSITNIHRVDKDIEDQVIEEFFELCMAQRYISEGGIEYAKQVLEEAIGADRAHQLINRLATSLQVRPFDFVHKADPSQLLNFIQGEHPQIIALVLSYLEPTQSAAVLGSLPQEKQTDVITRIAKMGLASPEYIHEAEYILERKLSSLSISEQASVGGIDSIVSILNSVDRSTEKYILESLEMVDVELADEIRNKLFVFEDIVNLSNQTIQRILKEVDNNELGIALKGATEEVADVIFTNVSKRLADMIKEDMEFMGPVRVRDVEEAQQKIVNTIRRLEDAGEIIISRGQEDDLIV